MGECPELEVTVLPCVMAARQEPGALTARAAEARDVVADRPEDKGQANEAERSNTEPSVDTRPEDERHNHQGGGDCYAAPEQAQNLRSIVS